MVAKAETATETESMEAAVGDCGSDASSSSSVESDEADGVMWKASGEWFACALLPRAAVINVSFFRGWESGKDSTAST